MKFKIALGSVLAILLFALLLNGCKKDNNNTTNGGTPGTTSKAVSIANFSFTPSPITVAKGTTITWTNNDSAPHTVTADDGSFTSGTLSKGDTYSHQFSSTGTVAYHCSVHTMMTASVVVQ